MATDTLRSKPATIEQAELVDRHDTLNRASTWPYVRQILMPLASLKLTVALFVLAIFLVFVGTLAQVQQGIWDVMNVYFRAWAVKIPLQVIFTPAFFGGTPPTVPGAFWFPGGFMIGVAMFINLLAAHALRFTFQARGTRLIAGLGVIGFGIALTWLIVAGASGSDTIQGVPSLEWSTIWGLFKVGLAATWVGIAYALWNAEPNRKAERAGLTIAGLTLAVLLGWLVYRGEEVMPSPSSLRILWQLLKAGLPAVVLLAGCWMVFRKRAGIVLLHAGIGLLMVNELIVYTLHEEGSMRIQEGETVNFVQDIRTTELAIVDPSAPDQDEVTVVPQSFIEESEVIQHEDLPFDIKPVLFLQNSVLTEIKPDEENLADAGAGKTWTANQTDTNSGTDTSGKVDVSAAYVQLLEKESGRDLGTYLVSLELKPQKINVSGKDYEVALRFKHVYKDYYVNLIDFRKDDYLGTNTPQNYSSDIRLIDPTRGVDREIKIWMNNPLRFAGETFYQSDYDPTAPVETTILQVVKNTGWMIPYVACMIVGAGLLAQFSITLSRFLRRRAEGQFAVADDSIRPGRRRKRTEADTPHRVVWIVPAAVVCISALWIASNARTPKPESTEFDLYGFGKLPLVYEGRVKPFDTLARNSLRVISEREYYIDQNGEKQPATRWLLDVIARPTEAMKHRIFRIHNLEILDLLGLERRKYYRYAIEEFRDKLPQLVEQINQAKTLAKADAEHLTTFQRKLLELDKRLSLFQVLMVSFDQLPLRADQSPADMMSLLQQQDEQFKGMQVPLAIPMPEQENWLPYARAWTLAWLQTNVPMAQGKPNTATLAMNSILVSYAKNDPATFNKEVQKYQDWLADNSPSDLNKTKTGFEAFFNHFAPFSSAQWLYFAAFVFTILAWLGWTRPLNNAAFWLIVFTCALHTFALVARMYISGRPPVTNLYTTAIFIGWGCVLLGIIFELVYGLGMGNIVASVIGFCTLMIADKLAGDGDTFTVLQAVLDTQFWLATHVTTINLGYSTTLVAGLLGVVYVIQGVLTPSLSPRVSKELTRMIYGTVCFSIFFSFVGTVLGGLWADDSWGRFWGWDPKENGALLIVLWNALVLHARWGGMVKERGLAVLAIIGNVFVGWSWFGVNELNIGLHTYGPTEGKMFKLGLFALSQLAVCALGLLPKEYWLSTRRNEELASA